MKPLYLSEISYRSHLMPDDGTLAPEDHEEYEEGDEKTMLRKAKVNPASDYAKPIYKQIRRAQRLGRPYAYGMEGGVAGRDREQLAKRMADRLGVKMTTFNLEHPDTDIENDDSRTMRYLTRKHGRDGALAIRHAFLGGQKDSRYKTKEGDEWLRKKGIDPDDTDALNRETFPQDFGKKPSIISRGADYINISRRLGAKSKLRAVQKQGYHAGGTMGRSHFKGHV